MRFTYTYTYSHSFDFSKTISKEKAINLKRVKSLSKTYKRIKSIIKVRNYNIIKFSKMKKKKKLQLSNPLMSCYTDTLTPFRQNEYLFKVNDMIE